MGKSGVRRSPRNQTEVQNQTAKAFVPSNLTLGGQKTFNFGGQSSSSSFVFTAKSETAALSNITNRKPQQQNVSTLGINRKQIGYKPKTGKLMSWADEQKKKREEMAAKTKFGKGRENAKTVIKGVRMNKRTELMMKQRNLAK